MRGVALACVFAAILVGLIVAVARLRSRFTVAWGNAGTIVALAVPAALLGQWPAALTLLGVGLAFVGGLARLDARDRRSARHR